MGPRGVYHPLIHTAKPIPRAGALLARGQTLKNSENPFGKLGINADAVVRHRKEPARTRELLAAYDLVTVMLRRHRFPGTVVSRS